MTLGLGDTPMESVRILFFDCQVKERVAIAALCVNIRPRFNKNLYNLQSTYPVMKADIMLPLNRNVERRIIVGVSCVNVGSCIHKNLHYLRITLAPMESG